MKPDKIGPYTLLRSLGQGGMAEVWVARKAGPLGTNQLAVIKRILPQHARDQAFLTAFVDEARLAVRLNHPNIVRVLAVGETPEEPYLALELVDGADLEKILDGCAAQARPMAIASAVRIAAEILRALAYAHSLTDENGQPLEVVHRDVSPPNILLDRHGAVKLADFGIAKAKGLLTKTRMRLLKGKTPYMSPEQVKGAPVDARSDLFALGSILWECLVGQRLFDSGDDLKNLDWVKNKPVPSPAGMREGVPKEIAVFTMTLLQRDPARRFPSAAAALAALEQAPIFPEAQQADLTPLVEAVAKESLVNLKLPTAELESESIRAADKKSRRKRFWRFAATATLLMMLAGSWLAERYFQTIHVSGPHSVGDLNGATLVLQPETAGAVAFWDSEPLGFMPLVKKWPLDGKTHELLMAYPGHLPLFRKWSFDRPRNVDAGESLEPQTGTIRIPDDFIGQVTLAGRVLGAGEELTLPAGSYLAQTDVGRRVLVKVTPGEKTYTQL